MFKCLTDVFPCPTAYVSEQHRFWRACAYAQACLNLCNSHIRICYNDSFPMTRVIDYALKSKDFQLIIFNNIQYGNKIRYRGESISRCWNCITDYFPFYRSLIWRSRLKKEASASQLECRVAVMSKLKKRHLPVNRNVAWPLCQSLIDVAIGQNK